MVDGAQSRRVLKVRTEELAETVGSWYLAVQAAL
jgi:hypothetical protein